jgi:hypothetical protein
MKRRSIRATARERTRPLPGDDRIADPIETITHAITIRAPRRDVWPWLAQMGAGRAGWYSYDRLDNGGRSSATGIVSRFQDVAVGTLFPAMPGATDGFVALAYETNWYLVLGWPSPEGEPMVTWTFALEELRPNLTRVMVRVRGSQKYPFYGLPRPLGGPVIRSVHFVMQRKQLLGIARRAEEYDPLLDRFVPRYDIVERHHIKVAAPADLTLLAASEMDLQQSPLIRAIFKGRELALGADPDAQTRPRGLLALTKQLGWGVLAETPGREVVMGAVTQPWQPNVVFRALPPNDFASFNEPGYVKIAWTLRADTLGAGESISRTETRVVATDAAARAKFRRYWAWVSPGVVLIRWLSLRLIKQDAERRALSRLRQDDRDRGAA